MRLTEVPELLADPTASSFGATLGRLSFGYFSLPFKENQLAQSAKAFSFDVMVENEARSGAPLLNPPLRFAQWRRQKRSKGKGKIKIKMDPSLRWGDGARVRTGITV